MQYVKHNGEYFRKIELKDLDKKELIKLIEEAVAIEPKVVHTWNHYGRWGNGNYTTTAQAINTNVSLTSSNTGITAKLNGLDKNQLVTLCATI